MLHSDFIKLKFRKQPASAEQLAAAEQRYVDRLAKKPIVPDYPDLPIAEAREDILHQLVSHQVIVLTGDTGSGKTTQLPKICLEAGLADKGQIVVTQPRRIAARAVATRIAEELGELPGQSVGFHTRFERQYAADGFIKVVTDGVLLNEINHQRFLNQYTCIIIDEAHERSLNIDFLLGYLKQLLPKRPDLKLIITSATIATDDFAAFFPDAESIDIPGRQFPVEVVYQPLDESWKTSARAVDADSDNESDPDELSLAEGVQQACESAWRTSHGSGDVLVFLPGEREIHETARHLKKQAWRGTDILPLFGRLSAQDQNAIFHPKDSRRVVLATNIAETSLTVPRIRFVVDSGLARISRYSHQSKIQRLPIEPISQASARQRSGRCGRLMPGICYRLYSEADFESREAFTAPEIQRVNLASVILQMLHLRLTPVDAFPFISPPLPKAINDGYKSLELLSALTPKRGLSKVGRQMAKLPIEPKLARVLIEAERQGALYPCVVIMAALSVQDIREMPKDKRTQAQQAHAEYRDPDSEFLFYWNCWKDLQQQRSDLSNNQFRKYVQKRYLRYMRVREWFDMVKQLSRLASGMDWVLPDSLPEQVSYGAVHQSIVAGFVAQVATRDEERWYIGPRGQKLQVFPGSPLSRKPLPWIVSGLWLETSKVFAHEVAKIQPEWIAAAVPSMLKSHYGEPYWQKKTNRVVATLRQTFLGLTVTADRVVNYAPINPAVSREVFIMQGLVEGAFQSKVPALQHNRQLLADLASTEERHRRVDLTVNDLELAALYDARLPETVVDGASFHQWYHDDAKASGKQLSFAESDLLQADIPDDDLPQKLTTTAAEIALSYCFEPGNEEDGVTATIPLPVLNQLTPLPFSWLVPNWLVDKITAYIKSLPKAYRRALVPAPDYAQAVAERLTRVDHQITHLETALAEQFSQLSGHDIGSDLLDETVLAAHLRMRYEVVDEQGQVLAAGRDLLALQSTLSQQASAAFAALRAKPVSPGGESAAKAVSTGSTTSTSDTATAQTSEAIALPKWGAEALPITITMQHQQHDITLYLGLAMRKSGVEVVAEESAALADRALREALVQLAQQQYAEKYRYIQKKIPGIQQLKLMLIGMTDEASFMQDLLYRLTIDGCFPGELPRSQPAVEVCLKKSISTLIPAATKLSATLLSGMTAWRGVQQRLATIKDDQRSLWSSSLADIEQQVAQLVFPGFLRKVPTRQLNHYERYFNAIDKRLDKLEAGELSRDQRLQESFADIEAAINQRIAAHQGYYDTVASSLWQLRELLQELRVSLYAQQLGTKQSVSIKRIDKQWQAVESNTRIPGVT